MKIFSIGYNYDHDDQFLMDRPNGNGCYLLLLIKEHSLFEVNGEKFDVKANSFIIFTPETPCKYRAAEKYYTDDWMFFEPNEADVKKFETFGIPLNEIVYLGNIDELSQLIHVMAYEHYSSEFFHDEIEKGYVDILFMKLGRLIQSKIYTSPRSIAERNGKFTQLRTRIFTMPNTIGSVEDMAAEMGMSRSGFQHLYKKMFGVSVMTDVINGRLDRAKRLLCATNLTVKEIAESCGYKCEYNFMRQFKSKYGKTPSEYRKII
ncbi:MAG: helix-turn-helix domain-containing protein [Oscillospiraceae bacterium]|nr:helix-turn-helix domain-containing protein [Oscillospiraceae bacterium]